MALKMLSRNQTDDAFDEADLGEDVTVPEASRSTYTWPDPAKPSAMLAPLYVREKKALAATKKVVTVGVVLLVVAVAVGAVAAFLLATSARADLATAQTARDTAQTRVNNLASIAAYYDGLETRREATENLLITDIEHSEMFQAFRDAMPTGLSLTSYNPTLGAPCPGPNPFIAPDNIGCLAVSGKVRASDDLAALLRNLKKGQAAQFFSEAFVTSIANEGGRGVTFSMNVNYTAQAFSLKYVPSEDAAAATQKAAAAALATQTGATQ